MAATFELVDLEVNEGGWGPINLPTHLLDAPYAPFSKGDKLGRVADWSGFGSDARAERIYSTGVLNQTFSLFQQDDSFQLVDNTKAKTSFQGFKNTRQPFNKRDFSKTAPAGGQKTFQKLSAKPKATKTRTFNKRNTNWNTPSKIREPSVEVKPEWKPREELDFNRLSKVTFDVPKPVEVKLCGSVGEYQRNFDRITIKTEKLFNTTTQILNSSVSTSDDPVIQQLAKTEAAVNVFGTDAIIALLMSAPRSVYPWDIIINRVGDKVFFDKRDRSQIDLSTVNENNPDPTPETEGPNSADALAREATSVNNSFIQQTVNFKTGLLSLPERPPFDEEGHPKGYRYRKFKLDDKITILLRTEFDAFIKGSPNSYITLKTLLEFDHKAQNNWRVKLDSQRGAIFAVEMKANINKLTRWTAEALLSGVDHIKLGYVSRVNPRNPSKHGLLTTQVLKPSDFATQINFSIANGWGIIKAICDSALALPEGKYLLLKDPNKAVMRFYEIPRDSFEEVVKEGKAEVAEGEEQPIEEEIDE